MSILDKLDAVPGEARAYTFLDEQGDEVASWSFAELRHRAWCVADAVLAQVTGPGARVLLLYPPGLDLVAALWGCLYAGVAPTLLWPPAPSRLQRDLARITPIVGAARPELGLTTTATAWLLKGASWAGAAGVTALQWVSTDRVHLRHARGAVARPPLPPAAESVAFLQFSSGSTGAPKGVAITHANVAYNTAVNASFVYGGLDAASTGVMWLPPYHDMGLVGGILTTAPHGAHLVMLSPLSFLKAPVVWLRAMTRYGATHSGCPNFALDLMVRKVSPAEREGLDLSSLRALVLGGETNRAETIDRFCAAFEGCGLRRAALAPGFALAEATLTVAATRPGARPAVLDADADALEAARQFRPCASGDGGARRRRLVSCGRPAPETEVCIVDEQAGELPAGFVGEIWVRGPGVASGGYFENEEATRECFGAATQSGGGGWLRTGDEGFLAEDGQLFHVGRIKELIIVGGRNLHPPDVEASVLASAPEDLRPGCCAAFSVDDDDAGEHVVVVAEVRPGRTADAALVDALCSAVLNDHAVAPADVVLVQARTVPKTTSGKIQRRLCRARYQAGELPGVIVSLRGGATGRSSGAPVGLAGAAWLIALAVVVVATGQVVFGLV